MEMSGEERIAAPRDTVWSGLNDPEILKQSIPGCEAIEKVSETEFKATVLVKVGPVKARFNGAVTLSDMDPPNGYTITGEGKGGAAGFGKGGARVTLTEQDGVTVLAYQAHASVGGKLAQIGSRLIDGAAKKMAADFFAKFNQVVAGGAEAPEAAEPEAATMGEVSDIARQATVSAAEEARRRRTLPPYVWIGALVILVLLILWGYGG